jgi:hypothetical protein
LTPDISFIILIPGRTAPRELGCCLRDSGVEIELKPVQFDARPCAGDQDNLVSRSGPDIVETSNGSEHSDNENECKKPDSRGDYDSGPFSLIKWIRKRIQLKEDNLQNIAVSSYFISIY